MGSPIRASLKLSVAERHELLQAIAMQSDATPDASRRKDPRFRLPESTFIVGELCQPGGLPQRAIIAGRDVGRGGMSFLHNCFLHPGTIVRFAFADSEKKPVCEASGVVRTCEHVRGSVHTVGVKFDKPLGIQALMRTVNRPNDATATCKYPALLSLTQEVVELVRNGTPLMQILGVIEEIAAHLRDKMPHEEPQVASAGEKTESTEAKAA